MENLILYISECVFLHRHNWRNFFRMIEWCFKNQQPTVALGAKVEMGCLEPLQLLPEVQVIQVTHGPLEARAAGTKTGDGHIIGTVLHC